MLTRLYVDNFRCFVKFEHKPGKRELILGGNGSGKSTLVEALLKLRQFVGTGKMAASLFRQRHRKRWLKEREQTFELEARLHDISYVYRLVIEMFGFPPQPRVASETVHVDGKPIFEFRDGDVQIFTPTTTSTRLPMSSIQGDQL